MSAHIANLLKKFPENKSNSQLIKVLPNYQAERVLQDRISIGTLPGEEDHVYYNFNIVNPTTSVNFLRATLQVTLDQSIVDNPKDYHLTIVRAVVPGQLIPIFRFQPQSGSVSQGIYSVTMTYPTGGTTYTNQTYLTYVPSQFTTTIDPIYYNMYQYQPFIDMTNNALSTCFSGLKNQVSNLPCTHPPYFAFNSPNQLIEFYGEKNYVAQECNGTPIQCWFNGPIYTMFDAFNFYNNGFFSLQFPNGEAATIPFQNLGNNFQSVIHQPYTGIDYPSYSGYKMTQEFTSLANWNQFKTIVFTSEGLPLKKEYIQSSGPLSQIPIVTDFTPSSNNNTNLREDLIYIPTGEYRLLDLITPQSLNNIDLTINFQSNDLSLEPVYLAPGTSINVKLLFRKDKHQKKY